MSRGIIFIILSASVFVTSCRKLPTYSDVPSLEYNSLTIAKDSLGNDNTFTLSATFTDGDGDVGYYSEPVNGAIFDSASSQYYYNFVITLSILENNVWVDTAFNISARLPYLTPTGNYKALKATIDKTDFLPWNFINTTIRFEAFIYDRALHKSNVITTPAIVVNTSQ